MTKEEFVAAWLNASDEVKRSIKTILNLSKNNDLKTKLLIHYMKVEQEQVNAESDT